VVGEPVEVEELAAAAEVRAVEAVVEAAEAAVFKISAPMLLLRVVMEERGEMAAVAAAVLPVVTAVMAVGEVELSS
jgi:hypothetical protein